MSKAPDRMPGLIAGPGGSLETLLEVPVDVEPRGLAVVCHPHPLYGGALTNKVAHTLARVACDLGLAALRFNFRGVGKSEGEFDHGVGEVADAAAALANARPDYPGSLLLAGFSFGGAIAMELARQTEPNWLVTVAPAVDRIERLESWRAPTVPWLLVQGDADELVSVARTIDFVNELEPGPELTVLEGVDHFFHGKLARLRELLVVRLQGQI